MSEWIKTAFDSIRAEDSLKANTLMYLQEKTRSLPRRSLVLRLASCAAIFILFGVFGYGFYFTPNGYVDVDVNPSVELVINRFDRVIDSRAYNEDGERVLAGLSLRHRSYSDALAALMEAIKQQGYIDEGGLVSVTIQTDSAKREGSLLANIREGVESLMSGFRQTASVDVFSVSGDTRSHAHELGISPAKYLAIQELLAIDPSATVESCRDHSISEIKELTREHAHSSGGGSEEGSQSSGGHHAGGGHH